MRGCLITLGLLIAGIVLVLTAYRYGLLGERHYRYKMAVEVETPNGVKTGYAVREIVVRTPPPIPMLGEHRTGLGVRGEAVIVDIAPGKALFALLTGADGDYEFGGRGVHSIFKELTSGHLGDAIELWPKKPVTRRPIIANPMPMLVRFQDADDPKSLEILTPDTIASAFGAGVSLRRIAIQRVEEPLTEGISKRFAWLNEMIRHEYSKDGPFDQRYPVEALGLRHN